DDYAGSDRRPTFRDESSLAGVDASLIRGAGPGCRVHSWDCCPWSDQHPWREDRTITFTPDMRSAYFVRRSPATNQPVCLVKDSHRSLFTSEGWMPDFT